MVVVVVVVAVVVVAAAVVVVVKVKVVAPALVAIFSGQAVCRSACLPAKGSRILVSSDKFAYEIVIVVVDTNSDH